MIISPCYVHGAFCAFNSALSAFVLPQATAAAAAAVSSGGAAASPWEEKHDGHGRAYFFNKVSGESQWNMPPELQAAAHARQVQTAAAAWQVKKDGFGRECAFASRSPRDARASTRSRASCQPNTLRCSRPCRGCAVRSLDWHRRRVCRG